jgi:hypothetical protein
MTAAAQAASTTSEQRLALVRLQGQTSVASSKSTLHQG